MKIIYGTGNRGKLDAMRKIIKNHGFDAELYTIKDIGFDKEIIENGKTFEENSEIKAKALKEFCNQNKIIDKMAQKIVKLDNSDQYCLGRKKSCPYNRPTLIKCKECVKYYYEKRNKR